MALMIKDLKTYPANTAVRGFPLLIKTARAPFSDSSGAIWQEVVFMDSSGEMLGHVLLCENGEERHHKQQAGYTKWQSKTNLCIMSATIQHTDDHKRDDMKLVVTECFNTATPLSWDQNQELSAEDWRNVHTEEIEGKIRHGLTLAWVAASKRLIVTPGEKLLINQLVDFIKTGE